MGKKAEFCITYPIKIWFYEYVEASIWPEFRFESGREILSES